MEHPVHPAWTGSFTRSAGTIRTQGPPDSRHRSYEAMATPSLKTVAKNGSFPACFSATRPGVMGSSVKAGLGQIPHSAPR